MKLIIILSVALIVYFVWRGRKGKFVKPDGTAVHREK